MDAHWVIVIAIVAFVIGIELGWQLRIKLEPWMQGGTVYMKWER